MILLILQDDFNININKLNLLIIFLIRIDFTKYFLLDIL